MQGSRGNGWAGATGLSLVSIIYIHLIGLTPSINGNVKVELLFAHAPSLCVCFLWVVYILQQPQNMPK